jgi:hypothetical protein
VCVCMCVVCHMALASFDVSDHLVPKREPPKGSSGQGQGGGWERLACFNDVAFHHFFFFPLPFFPSHFRFNFLVVSLSQLLSCSRWGGNEEDSGESRVGKVR